MVNVCALRCIGKEKTGRNSFTSQNLEERGDEMKDNKNELNADVESRHAKSNTFFFFSFSKTFYRVTT